MSSAFLIDIYSAEHRFYHCIPPPSGGRMRYIIYESFRQRKIDKDKNIIWCVLKIMPEHKFYITNGYHVGMKKNIRHIKYIIQCFAMLYARTQLWVSLAFWTKARETINCVIIRKWLTSSIYIYMCVDLHDSIGAVDINKNMISLNQCAYDTQFSYIFLQSNKTKTQKIYSVRLHW